MSYDNAVLELRQLLADTDFNKKATKKKLIGPVDGNNTSFFTYDKRISEDTLEVFVGNESVDFTLEDAVKGQITLSDAPAVNTKVVASYYWKFWLDEELINFLNKGAESTGEFSGAQPDTAYLLIQPGLKTAAMYFAANMANTSLVQYLVNRRHSEEFLVEQDGNSDEGFSMMIKSLSEAGDSYWKKAVFHRDDFYKRLGKRNAPAFAIKVGRRANYGPRR